MRRLHHTQIGGPHTPQPGGCPPPPPLCTFCHTFLPVHSPDALSMKHTPNGKKFPLGGVTHPKQTQKSRYRFPLSGIRPFGRFPPKPTKGGEAEVGLPLQPPLLLRDGDLLVSSRRPHPACRPRPPAPATARPPPPPAFSPPPAPRQLQDCGLGRTKERKKKHAITTAITHGITQLERDNPRDKPRDNPRDN